MNMEMGIAAIEAAVAAYIAYLVVKKVVKA
jgi:hypothetical protein